MRIAFLGASLTEGKYGGDWVAAARPHLPGHTLLNHGIAGSTINRLAERVGDVAADGAEACFVLPGSNDALAYVFPATRPYYKAQQDLPDGYLEPGDYAAYLYVVCRYSPTMAADRTKHGCARPARALPLTGRGQEDAPMG